MRAIFADTSYWIALTNVQDDAHEKAKTLTLSLQPRLFLTSEPVLTEYLNYFAAWGPGFRRRASVSVQEILASQTVKVALHTTEIFMAGLDLYRAAG